MNQIKKFAVVGHPIAHSKSPMIHRLFAEQFDLQLSYEKFDFSPDELQYKLDALREQEYAGVNITLPFKKNAFLYCNHLSARARQTESVNTIIFKKNQIYGDTTDGIGLVNDLQLNKVKLAASNILLLGAGGAAQGVLMDLIMNRPATLAVHNRTLEKAEMLVNKYKAEANNHDVGLAVFNSKADNFNFDVVINATSAGILGNELPIAINAFQSNTFYYDMTYGVETAFLREAKKCNANFSDGLGMLVCQAAESFRLWHDGLSPNRQKVIDQLKESF
jgi:shikimate dehydrogenase